MGRKSKGYSGGECFQVRDNLGTLPVPEEFIEIGKSQGFLEYERSYVSTYDTLWHVFRLVGTKRLKDFEDYGLIR